jgi:predicted RND superfamily exporter protein
MKKILRFIEMRLAAMPALVLRFRLLVVACALGITVLSLYGIRHLKFDFTIERWLKQDDAAFVAFEAFREQFGSDDGVIIVYKPKDGDVFSGQSLRLLQGIRNDLLNYHETLKEGEKSALERIVKVDTLINAPVLTVDADSLQSRWLVGDTVPADPAALQAIRKTARTERDLNKRFFSDDERYGVIYVKTDFGAVPMDSEETTSAILNGAEDLTYLEPVAGQTDADAVWSEGDPPKFKPTGMPDYVALNAAINEVLGRNAYKAHFEYYRVGNTVDSENQVRMGEEMGLLYMIGLLIMIITLIAIFRSVAAAAWPILIIVLSTIWTLGISGWLGLSISPFVVLTFLLILTIGMADVTHMMSGYLFFRQRGLDADTALRETYEKTGLGCFLTAAATMSGMLALMWGNLVPVINFAVMSAMGIALAFLLTITLLPILLRLSSPAPQDRMKPGRGVLTRIIPTFVPWLQRQLEKIVPLVEKRPFAFILPFALVLGLSIYGALKIKVDYSLYDQYSESSNFYQSIKLLDSKLAGASQMSLYVDLGADDGFQDPLVLTEIDALQRKLERDYERYVIRTSSIVETVKDAYQKQNDGEADKYAIPPTREMLSQTLFTFGLANPEERAKLVDETYRKANITINLRSYGSYEYTRVFEEMTRDIDSTVNRIKARYPDAQVSITGLFAMGMKAANYLVINELQSFGLSLLIISVALLLIFSSIKAGIISLIPNLVPSFLVLGLLGLLDIPLDFYTMMLAPIVVGIAVDDTIHFMSLYRIEVGKDGDIRRAVIDTVKECGQSIVFASMILGLGFGIMATASTPGLASLGKFGFIAIFSGLLCELFLTPALIFAFKLKYESGHAAESPAPAAN